MNKQLYSNTLRPTNYLFEHVVGLEQPPAGFPTYTYDPEKAKTILKQINWDTNKELAWIMWSKPTPAHTMRCRRCWRQSGSRQSTRSLTPPP